MYLKILVLAALLVMVGFLFKKPSNDRDWNTDQAVLPYAEINGDLASIHNIRNFTYTSADDYIPAYYDKTFDLSKLEKVYFIVEPFGDSQYAGHTFLSFEFSGNQFVSISIEIRKEKGEKYSPFKGLFKQYELMYVIADERDVVKLRTNYRKDRVYIYPVKTTPEKIRSVFLDMIGRTNQLRDKPEFYNTLTNNCSNNIVEHVNKIAPKRVPFSLKYVFPARADELAYSLGLIDTDLPFLEAKAKYLVTDKALQYADDPEFSVKIRED
ncbi:MAG: hypothetical protein A3J48_02460 [Candidatus Doudnabacteria bacterium RIFCSPHIGHO2_02_FULL_46_11]|uniref:Lnb N-terminal periplasmic domain-containing protein n=1 Tax=Candidatus Doudnabacteria bacterium RIFCSPHIGHO2_02_FULL_46_11 TaxID=1817832 RepID=A0A1F5P8S3_9BACT|nr:MAG: hypothetical protein A3J48_02460 [Candidatus Doudnabacteria bacterium RIFCSPHIGHO2_02_FULL_46_11]